VVGVVAVVVLGVAAIIVAMAWLASGIRSLLILILGLGIESCVGTAFSVNFFFLHSAGK
jgi:hypothetical protein